MANLSHDQFSEAKEYWERRVGPFRGQHERSSGEMPIEEMRKRIDPVFSKWDKFHQQEASYLGGLAEHIKEHGVESPITLRRAEHTGLGREEIYDGHHRLAAAELAGLKTVPWRYESRTS